MTSVRPVSFEGVFRLGPEEMLCAVLRDPESARVLPVWLAAHDAAVLDARAAGYTPRRPATHDLLADALTELGAGLVSVTLGTVGDGVFDAELLTSDGATLDARASDGLIITQIVDTTLGVRDDVFEQYSVFLPDTVAEEYFHTTFGGGTPEPGAEGPASASGDAQADADFAEMMRELGVDENDFGDQN